MHMIEPRDARITLKWPQTELGHFMSYKKMAAEIFTQGGPFTSAAYVLSFLLLHMHVEALLFESFTTIQLASRAGVSSRYQLAGRGLSEFTRKTRQGDLCEKLKLLSDQLVVEGAKTNLFTDDEGHLIRDFSETRNYLAHCCHITESYLRLGVAAYPLQAGNLGEDCLDAFRLSLTLEERLISAVRHIETTLYECVCHYDAKAETEGKLISFRAFVFKRPDGLYRALISHTTYPMPRISILAGRWRSLFNYRDLHWPLRDWDTMDNTLKYIEDYVERKSRPYGKPSPLAKHDIAWSPPIVLPSEWPRRMVSASDPTIEKRLKRLLAGKD